MDTNDAKTSPPSGPRWLIVSNRLPFKLDADGQLSPGSGGLVTAIRGIGFDQPATWLGAAPDGVSREAFDAGVAALGDDAGNLSYEPVFIEPDDYDIYYNRVCNDVLWPLLHYEAQELSFDATAWQTYREVNRKFADAIVAVANPGDIVWIHDYHLFLLPRMLRELAPELRVGFFLHVPFPSSEIFRQLPVREEVLDSLLDADLVGFHDYDYLRHFCSAVAGLLGLPSNLVSIVREDSHGEGNHVTELGVFPVSIDTARFRLDALESPEVEQHYKSLVTQQHCDKLILGVDRCDYMKGIGLKLQAFERYLETHPEARDQVRLLQIAVPSRTEVPEYIRLRQSIEQHVSEINGKYGSPNVVPVHYIFNSVPYHELLALYRLADVLLITSKRDGMNLVAKEYIACQPKGDPGVLVLSEFAGSSSVLSHALRINPWDIDQVADQLDRALNASPVERAEWHGPMLEYLSSYTASTWARTFVESLAKDSGHAMRTRAEPWADHADEVLERIASARRLVLVVDYDGTLVPIQPEPEMATLPPDTAERLRRLAARDDLDLVVVSGRDCEFLEQQLDGIDAGVACEHGARFRARPGEPSETLVRSETASWRPLALRIMRDFVLRTPDSRLEEKAFGIAWHYRNAPASFADHQAQKLALELTYALNSLPASVIHGDKVVEVRPLEATKGLFLNWLLEQRNGGSGLPDDTVLVAIGDDRTDEELFAALPPGAISIKVGHGSTQAHYQLARQGQVLPLLESLAAAVGSRRPPSDKLPPAPPARPPSGSTLAL